MHTRIFMCLLFCLTVVSGRHYGERIDHETLSDDDDQNDGISRHRDHTIDRHRRRRWQSNYGYDYPPPPYGYYPERRDDRNQQDLAKIVKLLEEISDHLRRPPPPPPPPQPIYIPYPVPYYPTSCNNVGNVKNITTRWPDMEDTNQNWGFVPPVDDNDDEDGARPISFQPIVPKRPLKRPAPKVEHGSQTDGIQMSTAAPNFAESAQKPNLCNAAILSCCANEKVDQKQCFFNFGCGQSFEDSSCNPESVATALENFKTAYSPMRR